MDIYIFWQLAASNTFAGPFQRCCDEFKPPTQLGGPSVPNTWVDAALPTCWLENADTDIFAVMATDGVRCSCLCCIISIAVMDLEISNTRLEFIFEMYWPYSKVALLTSLYMHDIWPSIIQPEITILFLDIIKNTI